MFRDNRFVKSIKKQLFETVLKRKEAAAEEKEYTFYWKTGQREVFKGTSPEDALTHAGYSSSALRALDFYAEGNDTEFEWNASTSTWNKSKAVQASAKTAQVYKEVGIDEAYKFINQNWDEIKIITKMEDFKKYIEKNDYRINKAELDKLWFYVEKKVQENVQEKSFESSPADAGAHLPAAQSVGTVQVGEEVMLKQPLKEVAGSKRASSSPMFKEGDIVQYENSFWLIFTVGEQYYNMGDILRGITNDQDILVDLVDAGAVLQDVEGAKEFLTEHGESASLVDKGLSALEIMKGRIWDRKAGYEEGDKTVVLDAKGKLLNVGDSVKSIRPFGEDGYFYGVIKEITDLQKVIVEGNTESALARSEVSEYATDFTPERLEKVTGKTSSKKATVDLAFDISDPVEVTDGSFKGTITGNHLDATGRRWYRVVSNEGAELDFLEEQLKRSAPEKKADEAKPVILGPDGNPAVVEPPKKEVPTALKEYKVKPPKFEPGNPQLPSPDMDKMWQSIKEARSRLGSIQGLITQAQSDFMKQKQRIEQEGGKLGFETQLKESIETLAAMVEKAQITTLDMTDQFVALKQEEKEKPFNPDAKWKLEKVLERFPEAMQYLEKAVAGAQNMATTEQVRELVFWPKKMSSEDKEGLFDVLANVYENLKQYFTEVAAMTAGLQEVAQ